MKRQRVEIYVVLVVMAAIVALVTRDWSRLNPDGFLFQEGHWVGFVVLLSLGLISESLTLPITIGKKAGSTSSIAFLPLLSSLLLFGPEPTVLFIALTGTVGEFGIRKKEVIKASFNSAQYVLAAAVGGMVFSALGGTPLAPVGEISIALMKTQLIAFGGFGIIFVILNNASVSLAIALSEETPVRKVWSRIIGMTGTNLMYDIAVSPIAIAVAFLYKELTWIGLLLAIFPLFFIRHAYLTIVRLQQANRDLLTALVKAMETRDPYTSGHSLRVASLAVRIADTMGFSPGKQRDIETAALLHDIGKIEAAYTEILGKPESLTPEERAIIESHVTKGVELLEQLSSFSKDVVDGVKGHHERVDGKGYPLGLKGDQIPTGAKIIKVCDAIDAMLSDRPYRKALSLPQVREQLIIYSGSQFDLEVVKAVIQEGVMEGHQAEIQLQREQQASLGQASPEVRFTPSIPPHLSMSGGQERLPAKQNREYRD